MPFIQAALDGSSSSTSQLSCPECRKNTVQSYPISSPLESLTNLFSSSSSSTPVPVQPPTTYERFTSVLSYIPRDPTSVGIFSAVAATGVTVSSIVFYRRYWRRIRTAEYVPQRVMDKKRWIKGVVTSVGDGDNFRLFHTPGPFFDWPFKLRSVPTVTKELKDQTIHIRISGIDAPEAAHFGRPSQPHSKESLEWLRETLMGNTDGAVPAEGSGSTGSWRKKVRCQVLRRDQYGRIVATPYIKRWILPDIPLPILMLQKGMAVVYESGGAEYGKWGLEEMKKYEEAAKMQRVGLWALPPSESPADYKKRYKISEGETPAAPTQAGAESAGTSAAKGVLGFFSGPIWAGGGGKKVQEKAPAKGWFSRWGL